MKIYEYILKVKDQFSTQFDKLKRAAGTTETSVGKVAEKMKAASGSVNELNNNASRLGSAFSSLTRSAVAFFSITAGAAFGTDITVATAKMQSFDKAIKFASGSNEEYAKNSKFLNDTIDRMGLPLESTTNGFKNFTAALQGTKLQGELGRKVFEGVSTGVAGMQLSGEAAEGAFLALGQMIGKGKVQAEELRGQLGERIPGAFQIAARAMNMTTSELDKFMSDGKLMAEDFLPKFAAEMKRTYGGALPEASRSLQAQMNRTNNEILRMKASLGEHILPVINSVIVGFGSLMTILRENWSMITNVATAVGIAALAWATYNSYIWLSSAATAAWTAMTNGAKIATILFTRGFAGLNLVMSLNPVGLIIAGIAALAAGFLWAYNKVEWFRGGMHALWEIIKFLGDAFMGLGKVIIATFTFNPSLLKEGLMDLTNIDYSGLGKKIAKAYEEGKSASGLELPDIFKTATEGPTMKSANTSAGDAQTQAGINNISAGGSKQMSVKIEFDKFVETLNINSQTMEEGVEQTYQNFLDMFNRLLNSGTYAITQR